MVIMKETILILAMFLIQFVIGDESCKTSFKMKALNLNRRLIGHTLSEFIVRSHHDCARECMSFLVCKSIDFHLNDKTCKLNDADSQSVNETEFEVKSGAVFSDITEWPPEMVNNCGSKPCTASQRCVPVGDTFTCIESGLYQSNTFSCHLTRATARHTRLGWSGDICNEKPCSSYPRIEHSEFIVIDLVLEKAKVICEPGYYSDRNPTVVCQEGGRRITAPRCIKATDCLDVLKINPFANSGVYDVKISETEQLISVYCDMDTEGGGWTVFQRRFNGSVDFFRTFEEYETGFGDTHGEFWLGLKKVQEMLNAGTSEVRIDVVTSQGRAEYIKYSDFELVNGDLYTLALNKTSLTGTVPDDNFGSHAGISFSTKDRDNDKLPYLNCAQKYHAAWWYSGCSSLNLNGFYEVPGTKSARYYGNGGVVYRQVNGYLSLKETKMMFRRT